MDRRSFVKGAVIGAGALGLSQLGLRLAQAEEAAKPVTLKLCSQDGRVPGKSVAEKVAKLEKWGASAIEFGGLSPEKVKEIKKVMSGSPLKVAAICWGSDKGSLVSMDMAVRNEGIKKLKEQLAMAGEIGSTGVIFVPTFNKQSTLKAEELDRIMWEILPDIGEYAVKCNSRVLLEPLNKLETYYINRVEQAAAICAKVNSPGICLMGDFYHMSREESDQEKAFMSGGKWLHHVHLATGKKRILPGMEPHSYVEGFKGLKKMGYQEYCSLECGAPKGTNWDEEIPKAFDYLRKQWEEAKI